ncbi:MAG: putative membrane-bound dehydrogenase-like protein [Verrucomicrobiales bacterium]|jgi:putative membrane-bound dehydrogenase-like protein
MSPPRTKFIILPVAILLAALPVFASDPTALTVPTGYTVTTVAEAPLVGHPMMGCFDERGRLFLAESAGFNRDEKQLDATLPNFIRMIEDTDDDGVFDKSTIFADKLAIPNGALWLDGALYVAEPPGIWRFTDTDDDGVADKREHIAGNVLSNGMSSTLHGPTLHPSGRLFWCGGQQGYHLDKNQEPPGGRIAPGVFTLAADGSDHEIFAVGGMANPVEVTFSKNGDVFGTLAILDRPDGVRHDGLLHWTYGGRFRPRSGVHIPLKPTGPALPPMSHVGQVAPAGLTTYRGSHFGEENRGAIFWSQFNTRTVMRTTLSPNGATYASKDEPFLVSTDIDFHPTDVIEDADGSLLVIDTGGWFRHGCPTSHIAKMDAKGAIYRIRRSGAPTADDPRGFKIDWQTIESADLTELLDDPRPAVLDRAMATLTSRGKSSLPALNDALRPSRSTTTRRNAVWTLARIDTPASLHLALTSIKDPDPTVRKASAFSLGMARYAEAASTLPSVLTEETNSHVLREIATALGRIGNPDAIPALVEALDNNADAFSRHSLIYALIEIGVPDPLVPRLSDPSPGIRRGALLALSQMENVTLDPEQIAPLLRTAELDTRQAAYTVALADKNLIDQAADALREQISTGVEIPEAEKSLFRDVLSKLTRSGQYAFFVSTLLELTSLSQSERILLIDAIRDSTIRNLPVPWIEAVEKQLTDKSSAVRLAAIHTIRERKLAHLDNSLHAIAADANASLAERLAAMDALAPRLQPLDENLYGFLMKHLVNQTSSSQLDAARTLASLGLSRNQLIELAETLANTGALVLPTIVRAFATPAATASDDVGLAFVSGLKRSKALTSLPGDELARLLNKFPEATRTAAHPVLAKLGTNLEAQQTRLTELSPLLGDGDFSRGKQLFFTKAACATCHRVSGQGGVLGPNLTTIAEIRSGPDLLESVVYPSASIVQGYEPYIVETKSGEFTTGIVLSETPDTLILLGADLGEKNIPVGEIAHRRIAPISLMPQGLDLALTNEEFADLMAFLQGLKNIKSFAPDNP